MDDLSYVKEKGIDVGIFELPKATTIRPRRPSKTFDESSERSKRRKTEELLQICNKDGIVISTSDYDVKDQRSIPTGYKGVRADRRWRKRGNKGGPLENKDLLLLSGMTLTWRVGIVGRGYVGGDPQHIPLDEEGMQDGSSNNLKNVVSAWHASSHSMRCRATNEGDVCGMKNISALVPPGMLLVSKIRHFLIHWILPSPTLPPLYLPVTTSNLYPFTAVSVWIVAMLVPLDEAVLVWKPKSKKRPKTSIGSRNSQPMFYGYFERLFGRTSLNTYDWDWNTELPVIGSLVYCEIDSLDQGSSNQASWARSGPWNGFLSPKYTLTRINRFFFFIFQLGFHLSAGPASSSRSRRASYIEDKSKELGFCWCGVVWWWVCVCVCVCVCVKERESWWWLLKKFRSVGGIKERESNPQPKKCPQAPVVPKMNLERGGGCLQYRCGSGHKHCSHPQCCEKCRHRLVSQAKLKPRMSEDCYSSPSLERYVSIIRHPSCYYRSYQSQGRLIYCQALVVDFVIGGLTESHKEQRHGGKTKLTAHGKMINKRKAV
uniref:Uncharacterized protein n=1 Tax=Timema douglasi TaxID=61478 RepID=A0A7R8VGB9_TIMDO|nr:unnamed protein product [Timema douglasi]